jgi:light-regulated signal transduction histidine kinase (bacteriophytochrome)
MTAALRADANVFQGYAVGAVDYLLKPVDPDILRGKVRVFCDLAWKTELVRRQAEELAAREREARGLLAEIERKNRELEALNRELSSFSYSVSHDLSAPLRAIDGFAAALEEVCHDRLDDQGRRYVTQIRAGAERMAQLVEGLLALSRVVQSDLRREEVDVTLLAREVGSRLAAAAAGRRVQLVVEEGLCARADARLLVALLENLLGNAFKFTAKRQDARIHVGRTVRDGETCLYVKDNGAGFDDAYAGKLFGAFQRLHGRDEFPGHGIGLATVQRIVQRHGGRVWADGRVDEGATFTFTLGPGGAFTPTAREFLDQVPNLRVEKPWDPPHLRSLVNERIR